MKPANSSMDGARRVRRSRSSDRGEERGSRTVPERAPGRSLFYLSAALVVGSLVFGGRASGTPISEGLLQILALWLLIRLALSPRSVADSRLATASVLLIVAILVTAMLQLVPLPYSWWAATSGAPAAAEVLQRLGEAGGMRALSLDTSATRETLLTLLPPIAIFFSMLEMSSVDRRRLALLVVAAAAASLVVGLLQFASQTDTLYLYETTHEGFSTGFFSNRNHQADLTLIGALLAAAFFRERVEEATGSRVTLMLMVGVVLTLVLVNLIATASRAGIALAIPALAASAVILLGFRKAGRSLVIALGAIVAIAAVVALVRPETISLIMGRFDADSDLRFEIWPTIASLVGDYVPLGSGLGTFVPVFQTAERLDTVGERFVNHAHNDYLEIALEMGIPGMLLILLFLGLFLWAAVSALRGSWPRHYTPLAAAAVGGLAVLLAHAIFDYSLRTTALAVTLALLMGLLMPVPADDAQRVARRRDRRSRA